MTNKKTLAKNNLPSTPYYEKALSGESMTDVLKIPIDLIDLNSTRFEYRFQREDDITLFAKSLKREGQKIPVILRGKKPPLQIICGFRRVRSLMKIGEKYVKAIILVEITDDNAHRLSIIENEERKSFTDLDRANCCKKLIKEGKTQEDVADILGCSQSKVSRYMSLLSLPEPIFSALKKSRISTIHALLLKKAEKLCSAEYLEGLIAEIEKKQLSTRELERRIKRHINRDTTKTERKMFRRSSKNFCFSVLYNRNMSSKEKQKMIDAVKEVLSLLQEEEEKKPVTV